MTSAADVFEFDVALSFAGADRLIVGPIAQDLVAAGVRVFYNENEQATTWGEDLVEYFDQVYRRRSKFVLIFVSSEYIDLMWTRHERRSAFARGLEQATP